MSTVVKDLGAATAYGYAVEKGYTGTEEEFAELMASYATVGQTAVDAKDAAVAAKTAAQTAATTATNKASEATTAAQTATTKAGEASTSASTATSAKDTAVSASQTATSKASEATTAAATATSAATTATTAKDDAVSAKTAAQTAQTGAETARDAVQSSAAQIATNASDITALKEELTAVVNTATLTRPDTTSQTTYQYVEFPIVKKHGYTIVNNSTATINVHSFSQPDASGEVVELLASNVASGASKYVIATSNASAVRVYYYRGYGDVKITDDDSGIYLLDKNVAELEIASRQQLINYANVTTGKYYGHGAISTSSSASAGIFPRIRIRNGVKYYFKELYAYFCTIVYDDDTIVALSNNSAFKQSGSFTAESDGYIYITVAVASGTISGTPLLCNYDFSADSVVEVYPDTPDIIQLLTDNVGRKIHFNDGTYDIIAIYKAKYGDDFFDSYTGYSGQSDKFMRGLNIGTDTQVVFGKGAKFTANYDGSNTAVRSNFSAFALESGVTIDGLNIAMSGIRNCIHDDFDNSYSATTVIKNCVLEGNSNLIAGGLGIHDVVIIENCRFSNTNVSLNFDMSYHNNGTDGAQSTLIIKDNYFANGVSIRWYGPSTLLSDVMVSNNSMTNQIDKHAENVNATVDNINLLAWNNEIRSA